MSALTKDLLFFVLKNAVILLVFVLLFTFVFGIMKNPEPSMSPAFKDGDLIVFHRYTQSGYMPRDAIVVEADGQKQVRRVIATEGDTVDITEDGLLINGALQQEPEIFQKTERYQEGIDLPVTVPEGHVFVLGDNRESATDSRIYGMVETDNTAGKVIAVIRRRSF